MIRRYEALIEPAAMGRGLRVFAGVWRVRHARADVSAFERAVVALPEVVFCHHISGHANRLAGLPGVAAVNSYVTMKTL